MKNQGPAIKEFLLENIEKNPKNIVAVTESHFKITRTTVHRHLNKLLQEERVFKSGATNNTVYSLASSFNKELKFMLNPGLSESDIWDKYFGPLQTKMPPNIFDICYYGFTEMFNNAIDHSEGTMVFVSTKKEKGKFKINIFDNGIGIFKKIKDAKGLKDEREAVLEISKGKVTTDPSRHSGEGIFFSSRVFDFYCILANGLCYMRDNEHDDWLVEKRANLQEVSTLFQMEINLASTRTTEEIFKKYVNPETFAFDKTHILVNLSLSNEDRFISRSQAKRILSNLEKFNHIVLDFRDVNSVGQAFVDEVFRVFQKQHPDIKIDILNANESVQFMIDRGIATARENEN
jgi:hypothetical protein